MRVDVPASTQARARPTRIYHSLTPHHVVIQVFDPVTLFVSTREMDLTALDVAGNPDQGFQFQQGIFDQFKNFTGELWATCNQSIRIEVRDWPAR